VVLPVSEANQAIGIRAWAFASKERAGGLARWVRRTKRAPFGAHSPERVELGCWRVCGGPLRPDGRSAA